MGGGEQIPSLDSAGVALYAHDLHFWELMIGKGVKESTQDHIASVVQHGFVYAPLKVRLGLG
jgi:hypothetical protein